MNTGQNWQVLLAKDLQNIFKTNYAEIQSLQTIDFQRKPVDPVWTKWCNSLSKCFSEWRGVVSR